MSNKEFIELIIKVPPKTLLLFANEYDANKFCKERIHHQYHTDITFLERVFMKNSEYVKDKRMTKEALGYISKLPPSNLTATAIFLTFAIKKTKVEGYKFASLDKTGICLFSEKPIKMSFMNYVLTLTEIEKIGLPIGSSYCCLALVITVLSDGEYKNVITEIPKEEVTQIFEQNKQ